MTWFGEAPATRVSDLQVERVAGKNRVSALVDGERLWYSCDDVALIASAEAFGSALLLPSLHGRRSLKIDAPVSETWLTSAARLATVWAEWWGYRITEIQATTREYRHAAISDYALAFSCGVDSFHALFTRTRPNLLVAVQGFDISLDDEFRMMALTSSVKAVAAEMGLRWTSVRTNFRMHRSTGRPWLWERSHGGALASVGHVLGDKIGRFGIAATYSERNQRPWGSTMRTDPFFSSDRVAIEHAGASSHREHKIKFLADNPLAQRHLRVCWANLTRAGNCSRCGKCLATMLLLAELGALDKFPVFGGTSSLPAALDSLPYLKSQINIVDRLVKRGTLPLKVSDAARRLVIRSRRAEQFRRFAGSVQRPVFDE